MEFDTNSVWVIVIALLLITIFIVVWYFYQEVLLIKKKAHVENFDPSELVHRIEALEYEVFSGSETESYEDEVHDVDHDDEICDQEELDEQMKQVFKDLTEELQRNSINIKEETEEVVSSNETVTDEVENITDEIEESLNELQIFDTQDSVLEHSGCIHILTSGKRKGQSCDKKCSKDEVKCKNHM